MVVIQGVQGEKSVQSVNALSSQPTSSLAILPPIPRCRKVRSTPPGCAEYKSTVRTCRNPSLAPFCASGDPEESGTDPLTAWQPHHIVCVRMCTYALTNGRNSTGTS